MISPHPKCPRLAIPVVTIAVALLACSPHSFASTAGALTDGAWSQLPPPLLYGHCAAYDPLRNRMIVFGGFARGFSSQVQNQVWQLPLTGPRVWSQLIATGSPPLPRAHASMIYDAVADRMIIFGGQTSFSSPPDPYVNEVWALSLAGTPSWAQLSPAGTPPDARSTHTAVYDSVGQRMIVYGGRNSTHTFTDTWALSLGGSPAWSAITPPSGPIARYEHTAVYDPLRFRMVIFAGRDSMGNTMNDLWTLALSGTPAWTHVAIAGFPPPPKVAGHSAIYDPLGDRMLVCASGDPAYSWYDRCVVYEVPLASATPTWANIGIYGVSGVPPSIRTNHSAIYSTGSHSMIVFGGFDQTAYGDAYELRLDPPMGWTQVGQPTGPLDRGPHSAIYDPVRDQLLVFGLDQTTSLNSSTSYNWGNETWSLGLGPGGTWAPLADQGTRPRIRQGERVVYDPARDRMLLFGGAVDDGTFDNKTYALGLASGMWQTLTPAGTPPHGRAGHSLILDPVRDRLLVFGGTGYGAESDTAVWALTLSGTPTWSRLATAGTAPITRTHHVGIYDPVRDRMVISEGEIYSYTFTDTWALSLSGTPTWIPITPSGAPPDPLQAGAYDPVRDRLATVGLPLFANPTVAHALSLSGGGSWSDLLPSGGFPEERDWKIAVYDPLRDRLVVYGNGPTTTWFLNWGTPTIADLIVPGDVVWTPGTTTPARFKVHNPFPFSQNVDYVLTSERGWPGFPIVGTFAVAGGATDSVSIDVPVPDTVANGLNTLRFRGTLRTVLETLNGSIHIHDALTAIEYGLIAADANSERVRLEWWSPVASTVTVQRRDPDNPWESRATISPDGTGKLTYEDRSIIPGHKYGYRLIIPDPDSPFFGEAWIDVPSTATFALRGARPNPSSAGLSIAFSLPSAAPARIEVLDVAGRVVRSADVHAETPGDHVIEMDRERSLAPGLYFVRLSQGTARRVTRAVVFR